MGFEIYINGDLFRRWVSADVGLTYDSLGSTFSLLCSADLANPFKSLSYPKIEIYLGEKNPADDSNLYLTGTITDDASTTEATPNGLRLSGYSLTGVLAECQIAQSSYPLQDDGKTLREIIQKILAPFNLKLWVNSIARSAANTNIAQAKAGEGETAGAYISKLAAQQGLVVGHTRQGELLLTKVFAKGETPRGVYVEGEGTFVKAGKSVQGRSIFSEYTVLRQPEFNDTANANPSQRVTDPNVGAFRPQIKKQSDGGSDATQNAAKSARMAGYKAIKFTVELNTFFYLDGSPVKPNRVISLKAPQLGLTSETELFVQSVNLTQSAAGQTAVLTCLLKEALSGEQAASIF